MPIPIVVPVDYFCLSRQVILANCVQAISGSGMSGKNSKRVTTFVCVMAAIAILIHVVQSVREQKRAGRLHSSSARWRAKRLSKKPFKTPQRNMRHIWRNMWNSGPARRPGVEAVAIVAASEDGKLESRRHRSPCQSVPIRTRRDSSFIFQTCIRL